MFNALSIQFDDARLKVYRAIRHINETEMLIQSFAQSGIHRLSIKVDPQTNRMMIGFEVLKQLPREIALPIGDTVHNLRTALDYIATRIVGRENDRITFPMHEEKNQLDKAGPFKDIVKACPDLGPIILDVIKPYKTGNYPLWALGKIDNFDKHKLLIPHFTITKVKGFSIENEEKSFIAENDINVDHGVATASLFDLGNILPGPFKVTSEGHPTVDVTFGKGSYFEGSRVVPTLANLAQITLGVIQTMEQAFFGTTPAKA